MGLQLCSDVRGNPEVFQSDKLHSASDESGKEETIFDDKREDIKRLCTTKAVATWNYFAKDESQTSKQKGIVPSFHSGQSHSVDGHNKSSGESKKSTKGLEPTPGDSSRVVSISKPVEAVMGATNSRMSLDQSSSEVEDVLKMQTAEMPTSTSSVRKSSNKELINLGLEAYITMNSKSDSLLTKPLTLLHRKISNEFMESPGCAKASLSSRSINTETKEESQEEPLKFVDNSASRVAKQKTQQAGGSSFILTEFVLL